MYMDDRSDTRPESRPEETSERPAGPPDDGRRAFLMKVAKGTVYAAPIIRTLAAPERLYAIDISAFTMGMLESAPAEPAQQSPFGTAPGGASPGSTPPPWQGGGPGGGSDLTGRNEE